MIRGGIYDENISLTINSYFMVGNESRHRGSNCSLEAKEINKNLEGVRK